MPRPTRLAPARLTIGSSSRLCVHAGPSTGGAEQAERDHPVRGQLVAHLEQLIAGSDGSAGPTADAAS